MPLEKAVITNSNSGDKLPVMFNPEEYTLSKDINYAQIGVPGLSSPILQFVHGNLQTLEMELFLDTYEEHREGGRTLNSAGDDVRKLTRKVTDLMNIDPETHAPPVLLVHLGVAVLHLRAGTRQPALHTVPPGRCTGARPAAGDLQ